MPAPRPPTPEHVLSFKGVRDAQLSPDGGLVTYVAGDPYIVDTKRPRSAIWAVAADGGEPWRLTSGPRSDAMPRWSPDGQRLAFLSDRDEDGASQLYLLPRNGGEATRLTRVTGDVPTGRSLSSLAWSPDGARIAYLMEDPETEDEKRRKSDKDDHIEFEKDPKYTRLYVINVETREEVCVSPDGLQVWEFCWAPSGQEFAAVASDLPYEQTWYTCRLVAFSNDGVPARTLHQSKRQVAGPAWSPDGSQVAFLSSNWSDRGMAGGGVFVVPAEGGTAREVGAGQQASVVSLEWSGDSQRLLTAAHERGGA